MSTQYPILDNRPINKWKVTELKEELKKRRLATKGLKDDLVKRLNEAIHIEWEANKAEEDKRNEGIGVENSEDGKAQSSGVNLAEGGVGQYNKVDEVEVKDLNPQTTVEEYEGKPENKILESSHVASNHNKAYLSDQVFDEVSPNLGFKVNSESFSTDTLTNNENELKDNLNADNVQLESEIFRQEMVQPSFGRDSRGGGTIYLSDDLTSHGNQTLHGVTDDKPKMVEFSEKNYNEDKLSVHNPMGGQNLGNDATENIANVNGLNQMDSVNASSPEHPVDIAGFGEESSSQDCHDFNKTIGMMDGELLEKVNLDQSSADEMEDTLDNKFIEPDQNSSEINDLNKAHGVGITALSEKRKFQDVTESGSNEPLKRQRIWNNEGPRASDLTLETPKERVVPPSERTPTPSVRIDNFVRPFTLKAVQELLAKTGEVRSFWMDHIKTHCYVTFSSAEEAIETRNAVYNLQWPTNGGRLLIADFVDPEEVKLRVKGLSQSAEPLANANTSASDVQPPVHPPESTLQELSKQYQDPPHPLSRVPPSRGPSSVKDQLPRAAMLIDENVEPPIPTLDDLFRKTKATPRIYYSPLSDKEVAAKVSRQKRDRQ